MKDKYEENAGDFLEKDGDVGDQGAARQEQFNQNALRVRKPEGPAAVGHCLYCGEDLPGAARWCDAECRDDYEVEQKARR